MINNDTHFLLEYNLQFFANDDKTEPATPKKLDDARKEGQIAKSKELVTSVFLLVLFLIIKIYAPTMGNSFMECFKSVYAVFETVTREQLSISDSRLLLTVVGDVIIKIVLILLPILAITFVVAFVMNAVQFKWKVTTKPLQPNLNKFNPMSGLKRMFSVKQIIELIKNIAMILVIAYVVYNTIKEQYTLLYTFYDITLARSIYLIWNVIVNLGIKISIIFLIIGVADFIYQKYKFKQDMKMTKQETKDEYKQSEGDPQVKGQIKRRMQEASRRRMMQSLPEADVVITNPTHFAVAIKYDANVSKAPVVIAKGADYLAFQIKDKAKEYSIEIVENKPLARLLYNNVDVGAEIPPELYQAVAEVLAFVYSLHHKL